MYVFGTASVCLCYHRSKKRCFHTNEILQMYDQQIENESSPIKTRPREPSLDYLPDYNKKEPALESANENSSTHSNEILQMYNQQIENVKENESSLIIRRPREPSLDYLPEFVKKERSLEKL